MDGLKPNDKDAIRALYEMRLAAKEPRHAVVGWGSVEDQELRFQMLLRELAPQGARILDIGCGLGDLIPFLDRVTDKDYDYLGIDIADKLIKEAKKIHGGKRRAFRTCDILEEEVPPHDIVLLSGALSFRVENNEAFARAMLKRMYELCTTAAAANFLSTYVDFQHPKNYHYAPEDMFRYGKSLTKWTALYHDYPLWEFTLQMRKSPLPQEAP